MWLKFPFCQFARPQSSLCRYRFWLCPIGAVCTTGLKAPDSSAVEEMSSSCYRWDLDGQWSFLWQAGDSGKVYMLELTFCIITGIISWKPCTVVTAIWILTNLYIAKLWFLRHLYYDFHGYVKVNLHLYDSNSQIHVSQNNFLVPSSSR